MCVCVHRAIQCTCSTVYLFQRAKLSHYKSWHSLCVFGEPNRRWLQLYLQLAINTYKDLFTVSSCRLWDIHCLSTLRPAGWMGVCLSCQLEDADGGHIDTCFWYSASWDHAMGSLTLRCSMPEHIVLSCEDKYYGWLFAWLCLSEVTLQMCMLQTSFLSSKRGEKEINCLAIVSRYSKLLCTSSATVNWPLVNLTQHCLAAALSQTSFCFCFWGFSHAHPVAADCLSSAAQLTSHSQLTLGYEALCSLHAFVCTTEKHSMPVYKCAYLHSSAAGGICVYVPICGQKPLVEGPEHRLKKTGTSTETASRANSCPRLQVETIPDSSPICFHFRVWVLN